jgi:hypothetical protein
MSTWKPLATWAIVVALLAVALIYGQTTRGLTNGPGYAIFVVLAAVGWRVFR